MSWSPRRLGMGLAAAVGILLAVLEGPTGAGELVSLEERARTVEARLIAPCCFSQTVDHHGSPQAAKIRQEIRERLSTGATESEILDAFVERYGERILAAPRATGFGVLAYLVPPLFVLLGGGILALWLRRHRVASATAPSSAPGPAHVDPEHLAELPTTITRG